MTSIHSGQSGADLLEELYRLLTRYVVFPSVEAVWAVTLYIAATHAPTAWEHATRLVIKSPIKRCGKTRLQEVCRETVHNALPTTNISPAALARSITDNDPPTLILDEADTVWGKKDQRTDGAEDLRGILNSGHSRGWPYVRWDAAARRRELCPTFAMAIIGGIGDMPDTIEDRAVVISMRRRAFGEHVAQWRTRRAVPMLRDHRDRLHGWVAGKRDELAAAQPDLPVRDRAADVWEPLVVIADAAGGPWPERARAACVILTGDADQDEPDTAGERLLADLKTIFGTAGFLYTATILGRLTVIEDAPWSEWRRGPAGREPINARGLAALLKPYGIRARNGREDGTGKVQKGYYAGDMLDAWSRYVRHSATSEDAPQADPVAEGVAPDPRLSATDPVADDVAEDALPGRESSALRLFEPVADVSDVAATRLSAATRANDQRPCDMCAGSPTHIDRSGARLCRTCAPHLWRKPA